MALSDLKAIDFNSLQNFEETENNNSFFTGRQNNSIGDITNLSAGLSGTFDRDQVFGDIKDVDFYHFTVTKPTQFNAIVETVDPAFQDIVRFNLFTDFNDDGTNNDGVPGDGFPDLLIGNRIPEQGNLDFDRLSPVNQADPKNQLVPGEYYLSVSNIRTQGQPIDYEVKLEAPELETAQLNLTIGEIAPDADRGGETPVRFEAEVAGQVFERRFDTDFERTVLPVQLDPDIQKADIKIRAFRLNDDGSETRIDLNGRIGEQELELTYDTLSGKLFKRGTGIEVNEGQGVNVIARNETRDAEGAILPGFIGLNVTYDTTAELSDPVAPPAPGNPDIDARIVGTADDDVPDGNNANNQILGLEEDDIIDGKGGDDIIQGAGNPSNPNSVGNGETDRLTGGAGKDTFVLHTNNGLTRLYDDGRAGRNGRTDMAVIEDFNRSQDTIEVAGSREEYFVSRFNRQGVAEGRAIFHDTDGDGRLRRNRDELIAITNGLDNLVLDDLEFIDTPVTIGSNQAERLQGTGQDGILNGRGKRDIINAKGGDDIVLGGNGNDMLNGGSGDDILDGGRGRDKYRGKAGSDIFVIRKGQGSDQILDFKDGVDMIGLAKGLAFEDLSIQQGSNRSIIRVDDEKLAVVRGVQATQLGVDDFVSIDYTRFEGMKVPVALEVLPTVA
ncbi:MAG TPA: hypothetical protein ACFE0H_07545 [Elainellaceae cyanobacterium]